MKPQTTQEKEYNRMAMAKVRADVRKAMEKGLPEGMNHLGDYPRTMEDAVRTIIALQDMLDHSMMKHRKCEEHLVHANAERDNVLKTCNIMLDYATTNILKTSEDRGQMVLDMQKKEAENKLLMESCNELEAENHELMEKMDAHKIVLKLALNEEGLG